MAARMYETWYMMTVMLQSGLDISPVITHRFGYEDYRTRPSASTCAVGGAWQRVILRWAYASLAREDRRSGHACSTGE